MTPTLQYKHVVIRTTKWLLKGEEINDITFHDKGDNRGHLFELHTSIVHLGQIFWQMAVNYWYFALHGDPNLHHELSTLWTEFQQFLW